MPPPPPPRPALLCQEDEVLYGRAGYLLGCLLLNKRLQPEGGAVPQERVAAVVRAIVESGDRLPCC